MFLSRSRLVVDFAACGLSAIDAQILVAAANACGDVPAEQAWARICHEVLRPDLPATVYALVHRYVFRAWPPERGPAPAWFPGPNCLSETNVGQLMAQLGLASYEELYRWSITERAKFWDLMVGRLGIRFSTPYSHVVDDDKPEHPKWFVGAELNIAESCFQAPPAAVAVRYAEPDGRISEWTYAELLEQVDRVAGGLERWGLRPGDPVAIDMPMSAEAVAIY